MIAVPYGETKTVGSCDQQAVADRVTEPVVHELESVEIDEHNGVALASHVGRGHRPGNKLECRRPIQT